MALALKMYRRAVNMLVMNIGAIADLCADR